MDSISKNLLFVLDSFVSQVIGEAKLQEIIETNAKDKFKLYEKAFTENCELLTDEYLRKIAAEVNLQQEDVDAFFSYYEDKENSEIKWPQYEWDKHWRTGDTLNFSVGKVCFAPEIAMELQRRLKVKPKEKSYKSSLGSFPKIDLGYHANPTNWSITQLVDLAILDMCIDTGWDTSRCRRDVYSNPAALANAYTSLAFTPLNKQDLIEKLKNDARVYRNNRHDMTSICSKSSNESKFMTDKQFVKCQKSLDDIVNSAVTDLEIKLKELEELPDVAYESAQIVHRSFLRNKWLKRLAYKHPVVKKCDGGYRDLVYFYLTLEYFGLRSAADMHKNKDILDHIFEVKGNLPLILETVLFLLYNKKDPEEIFRWSDVLGEMNKLNKVIDSDNPVPWTPYYGYSMHNYADVVNNFRNIIAKLMKMPTKQRVVLLDPEKPITMEMIKGLEIPDCFGKEFDRTDSKCIKCHDEEVCGIVFKDVVDKKAVEVVKEIGVATLDESDFSFVDEKKPKILELIRTKHKKGENMHVKALLDFVKQNSKCPDEVAVKEYVKRLILDNSLTTKDGLIYEK